ncbi:MAG TPA: DNA-formamidopyrimidine glycosylase family protein [Opitutus sp.]|nr:DNA-formamidopyrimidine glycosylase family protein [Opitutus sp.]
MPELAEVEFFRKRWHQAAVGQRVARVLLHPRAKVFRGTDPHAIADALVGTRFESSAAAAKQMLFRFDADRWLGVHLGMSGDLYAQSPDYTPAKHDHLVLAMERCTLVFSDPRMFGRVQFHRGEDAPDWWTQIAPPILSRAFTVAAVSDFLRRRARAPIKSVLLMQERFPGIGNWMADEILWRAALHPQRAAGSLDADEIKTLWRECRHVARLALDKIAGRGKELPPDLNVNIPDSWLFHHRWRDGGRCPLTGVKLRRTDIGGRTTCWSPARQKLKGARA